MVKPASEKIITKEIETLLEEADEIAKDINSGFFRIGKIVSYIRAASLWRSLGFMGAEDFWNTHFSGFSPSMVRDFNHLYERLIEEWKFEEEELIPLSYSKLLIILTEAKDRREAKEMIKEGKRLAFPEFQLLIWRKKESKKVKR